MHWIPLAYALSLFAVFLVGYCPYRALTFRRGRRLPYLLRLMGGSLMGFLLATVLSSFVVLFFQAGYIHVQGSEDAFRRTPDSPNILASMICFGWIPWMIGIALGDCKNRRMDEADTAEST